MKLNDHVYLHMNVTPCLISDMLSCLDESFAFETTLSGRHYAQLIPQWQSSGYRIKLFFLKLVSPELAIARVRQRVRSGGHDVPEPVIRRRFATGLSNFAALYKPIVDEWALYDNSGSTPLLLKEGVKRRLSKHLIQPPRSKKGIPI